MRASENWKIQIQGFPAFLSDYLPLELMPVRLGPGQFEFETRFRSVRVQRLPLFDQVITIFKKELETIDVFRSFFPVGDVMEHECDRRGIFSKAFARNRG